MKLTSEDETIVSKHGNKTGTSAGTVLSSKSPERRAKHLRAPCTRKVLHTIDHSKQNANKHHHHHQHKTRARNNHRKKLSTFTFPIFLIGDVNVLLINKLHLY